MSTPPTDRDELAPLAPEPTARPVRRAILVSVIAVLVCMPAWLPRWQAERAHPGVELAVSDTALRLWQNQVSAGHHSPGSVYPTLSQAGAATIVVGMHQLADAVAARALTPVSSSAIVAAGLAKKLPSHGKGVWIASAYNDPSGSWRTLESMLADRVKTYRSESVAAVRVRTSKGWIGYLRWNTRLNVNAVPVGFDHTRLQALQGAKVPVILALPARSPASAAWLANEVGTAAQLAQTKRLLFAGALFARPAQVDRFARAIAAAHYTVVVPDLTDLAPAEADLAPYTAVALGQVVRAHLMTFGTSASTEGLIAQGRRGVKERGVRLVVVVPPPARTRALPKLPADVGLRSLAATDPVLSSWQHNMPTSLFADSPAPVTGKAAPLPVVDPGFLTRGAALLGAFIVLAAAMFSLTEMRMLAFGKVRRLIARPLVAVAFCVVSIGCLLDWLMRYALLDHLVMLAVPIAAATSAVLVAMTGAALPLRVNDRVPGVRWLGFVGRFCGAVATAVAGGMVLGALGSSTPYMISSTSFTGVKALLVTPVVVVAVIGLCSARVQLAESGERMALSPRVRWTLIGIGTVLVLGFGALYLVRSGNSGDATESELWLRDRLDELLYVRPRFKEILLGFPVLILALRWPGAIGRWVCAAVATVGTADVLDTFAHFHSPLPVELLRTGYAAAGGLVIGLIVAGLLPYLIGPVRDAIRNYDRRAAVRDQPGNEEPASL